MGPGQYPQYTLALHGGEAVGGSSQQHSTAKKMSANSDSFFSFFHVFERFFAFGQVERYMFFRSNEKKR